MKQSAYLCVILCVKHKKISFFVVLTWFLIHGKIQNSGQDGDHCWWRHRSPVAPPPIKYTWSCWEDQKLSTGKSFRNTATYQKLSRGVLSFPPNPPPPPLPYQGGGMNLRGIIKICLKKMCFQLNLKNTLSMARSSDKSSFHSLGPQNEKDLRSR